MFHLVWMFLVGIVVGAIARWIVPGTEHMGFWMTGLLGIAGSFVGGFVARLFSPAPMGPTLHPAGFVLSIVGAVMLLFLWGRLVH